MLSQPNFSSLKLSYCDSFLVKFDSWLQSVKQTKKEKSNEFKQQVEAYTCTFTLDSLYKVKKTELEQQIDFFSEQIHQLKLGIHAFIKTLKTAREREIASMNDTKDSISRYSNEVESKQAQILECSRRVQDLTMHVKKQRQGTSFISKSSF
jgi:hypothetical protein